MLSIFYWEFFLSISIYYIFQFADALCLLVQMNDLEQAVIKNWQSRVIHVSRHVMKQQHENHWFEQQLRHHRQLNCSCNIVLIILMWPVCMVFLRDDSAGQIKTLTAAISKWIFIISAFVCVCSHWSQAVIPLSRLHLTQGGGAGGTSWLSHTVFDDKWSF